MRMTRLSKASMMAASRRAQGRRCSWPLAFRVGGALMLVYLLSVWISSSPKTATAAAEDGGGKSLASVATYLRDGDVRLVRPAPSETTAERQKGEACQEDLERAYTVLTTSKDTQVLVDAAQVVALCTTNNPKNRAKLTTVKKGVPEALVKMVDKGSPPAAIAAAGECIWISTFNSPENYDALVKAGAVGKLASVITDASPCADVSCYHAKMWSAAALQNLAATYCSGGHGYCDWEQYDRTENDKLSDGENVRYQVALSKTAKPKHDPTPVREELLNNPTLMASITKTICDLEEDIDGHPSDRMWPSRANVPDDINHPHIVPWAYIGMIKNIAFAENAEKSSQPQRIPDELMDCLCEYAVHSPDWLENSKAQDALWNLGWDFNNYCEPVYDPEECQDYANWKDADGNGCATYEEERWCPEWGDTENEDGVTPDDACCACGGGEEVSDEF